MSKQIKILLLSGVLTTMLYCKKEVNLETDTVDPEMEVAGLEGEVELSTNELNAGNLTINSKNLKDVVNEFKIDPYAAADKYGGKEALVSIALSPSQQYKNQETLLYNVNSTFNGLPIIKNDHPVRMYVDTDLIKNDQKLQGYIQLTDGEVSAIVGSEPLGINNKWYIIYNKKTDEVDTGRDQMTDLIAGYIRLKKNNAGSEVMEQINSYMKDESGEILDHLTSGNLYYAEFNKEGNLDESAYLLPCEYVFKGTISKDIEEKESNYGVRKIDMSLVGSELVDTKWFIDKNEFFNKQVK